MRTKLTVAAAAVAALLATSLVSGSAQATSLPVLKSNANQSDVTLVGKGGGRGGGGHGGHGGFKGGGGKAYSFKGGGRSHAYRGGGGGGKNYAYKAGKNYAYKNYGNYNHYKNHGNHNRYKNYGHYNNYRRFYGWPYIGYNYGYGGCG